MRRYFNQLYATLSPPAKRALIPLVFGFLLLSLFDLLGISLIGPFMAAFASPDFFSDSSWGNLFLSIGAQSPSQAITVAGVLMILLFYLKAAATFYVNKAIVAFGFREQARIRNDLLRNYLDLSLEAYTEKSSSTLFTSVQQRTVDFTLQGLIPALRAFANLILLVAIFLFLLFVDWIVTNLLMLLFGLLFLFYNRLVKRRLVSAGADVLIATNGIASVVSNASMGFKETRVLGCEEYFKSSFRQNAARFADAATYQQSLTVLPRQLVESALVTAVVLLVIATVVLHGGASAESITTVGIFGFAAFRCIAALNAVMMASNQIRYSKRAVADLHEELGDTGEASDGATTDDPAQQAEVEPLPFNLEVAVTNVSYRYPQGGSLALDGICLRFPKGAAVGIIGRSGSGKTTLVDVLLGLLTPATGVVEIDGQRITGREREWMNHVAYIPQGVFLLDASIKQNVALGIDDSAIDPVRLQAAIELAQLSNVIARLPKGISTIIGEHGTRLSGGQRQRVALARAFYHERNVVVMDEATAALDNETERQVVEAIKNLHGKKTVIVIAHRLSTVRHCDIIYKLEGGRMVDSGTYDQVVRCESTA